MQAKLYRTILPVADIEAAARFYAAVLGEPGERVSGGRRYFCQQSNGAVLACYDPRADGDANRYGTEWHQHPLQYVYFSTSDLDAARASCLEAGAKDVTEIVEMPWGETMFYALDPFDNPISFVRAGTEFTGASA